MVNAPRRPRIQARASRCRMASYPISHTHTDATMPRAARPGLVVLGLSIAAHTDPAPDQCSPRFSSSNRCGGVTSVWSEMASTNASVIGSGRTRV
jgi:hypothetical protein